MVSEQIVGIDFGSIELSDLEHELITRLGRAAREIGTHVVDGQYVGSALSDELTVRDFERLFPDAHVCLAVVNAGAEVEACTRVVPAEVAADAHAGRRSGRLVRFKGDAQLAPVASVGHIKSKTDIQVVVALGAEITDDHLVHLNGFVRPVLLAGQLFLHVTAGADDTFRTFETANPHQCCGGAH